MLYSHANTQMYLYNPRFLKICIAKERKRMILKRGSLWPWWIKDSQQEDLCFDFRSACLVVCVAYLPQFKNIRVLASWRLNCRCECASKWRESLAMNWWPVQSLFPALTLCVLKKGTSKPILGRKWVRMERWILKSVQQLQTRNDRDNYRRKPAKNYFDFTKTS